jgi:hypothetical protein
MEERPASGPSRRDRHLERDERQKYANACQYTSADWLVLNIREMEPLERILFYLPDQGVFRVFNLFSGPSHCGKKVSPKHH